MGDDPSAILANLKAMGPAVWMIDASCLQFYSGGVLLQSSCASNGGTWPHYNGIDHATTMVGAGTANGVAYWRVKNSWGSRWGDAGYVNIARDSTREGAYCILQYSPVFPVMSGAIAV